MEAGPYCIDRALGIDKFARGLSCLVSAAGRRIREGGERGGGKGGDGGRKEAWTRRDHSSYLLLLLFGSNYREGG